MLMSLCNCQVNVDSVRTVLDTTRKYGGKAGQAIKFIFTSSLAVYGGPLVSSRCIAPTVLLKRSLSARDHQTRYDRYSARRVWYGEAG